MISIIITTKKEPETLSRAINAILDDIRNSSELATARAGSCCGGIISKEYEVLVVGPDEETKKITTQFLEVKFIRDKGVGKPAALNLALRQALGEILILTDGDVWIEKGAIQKLIKHFDNDPEPHGVQGYYAKIGAVSGRPVATNLSKTMFGYWAKFLTDAADWTRHRKSKTGEYLVCTGYLYAFRNIIKEIPADTLIEDGIISQMIWQNSYKIVYEPEAIVYVKFPTNFSDWFKQKIRSTGGYVQRVNAKNDKLIMKKDKMRGFFQEISDGLKLFFTYPRSPKEFFWTILLYLARLYLWLLIFIRVKIFKKYSWERVESTK